MTLELIFYLLIIIVAILLSAFFSGTETGLYTVSHIQLKLKSKSAVKKYAVLKDLMEDRHSIVFTILCGNNISNFMATSFLTGFFITYFGPRNAEFLTMAVMTPLLFIFGEVLPKNIFYNNADIIMPLFSRILWLFNKIFTYCGVVPFLSYLAKKIEKITGIARTTDNLINTTQKHQVMELIMQTHEEGILGHVQAGLIERFTSISNQNCLFIANPVSKMHSVNVEVRKESLVEKAVNIPDRYWLVYKEFKNNIIGFIDRQEVLKNKGPQSTKDLLKPIVELPSETLLINAINMIYENKIVLLTSHKRPVGIITMDDILAEMSTNLI